ncbi:glycosyltransferase family 39 protein [Isosphaeraceae bacterium EP7]
MIPQIGTTRPASLKTRGWTWGAAIGLSALLWFFVGIPGEDAFVDEWAYVSQSYYADLYLSGNWDDRMWLDYPAYDLPPLPKYTIGLSLMSQGYARPKRAAAVEWYRNTSYAAGPRSMLIAARWPTAVFGAFGCVALFALGSVAFGRAVGLVAAILLALNPLYALHSRRAMSDVPAEALILATEALALFLIVRAGRWSLARFLVWVGVGILGGLAVLSKLNGSLALMTVVAWSAAVFFVRSWPAGRKWTIASATVLAGCVGLLTFALGNPFLTANPAVRLGGEDSKIAEMGIMQRARYVADHRVGVSSGAAKQFPNDALTTLPAKVSVMLVQGLGRFGPFGPAHSDSTKRFDRAQDWGALPWGFGLMVGAFFLIRRILDDRLNGRPPTALLIAVQVSLAVLVVTAFIPLAWDRYFLSIQPSMALLGALGLCSLYRWLRPNVVAGSFPR